MSKPDAKGHVWSHPAISMKYPEESHSEAESRHGGAGLGDGRDRGQCPTGQVPSGMEWSSGTRRWWQLHSNVDVPMPVNATLKNG